MIGLARRLWQDRTGASAAEFAMVVPLLLLFIFGAIDVGRFMWTMNEAEKAAQMGARFAVATDVIPTGMASYSYAVSGGIAQGDPIPQNSFPGVDCTSTACTCKSGGSCPFSLTRNATAFTNLVTYMSRIKPDIAAGNVTVSYDYSGLGYAGNPNGPDVSPLITVNLRNLTFQPITLLVFGASFQLPIISATLTMEDGIGTSLN